VPNFEEPGAEKLSPQSIHFNQNIEMSILIMIQVLLDVNTIIRMIQKTSENTYTDRMPPSIAPELTEGEVKATSWKLLA